MGTKRGQEKKARDSDDSGKGEVDRVKGTIRPVHGHMWIESEEVDKGDRKCKKKGLTFSDRLFNNSIFISKNLSWSGTLNTSPSEYTHTHTLKLRH